MAIHEAVEHAAENRRMWNAMSERWVDAGDRAWRRGVPTWGAWSVPETERITLFPYENGAPALEGARCAELGCGTGYVSRWMEQRGANVVVGFDQSDGQLATAAALRQQHGSAIHLVQANAELLPARDESFDVAVSEYGAATWCDPHKWIAEAHRVLRPGGWLAFLNNHPLASVCFGSDGGTATRTMQRPYLGICRLDWTEVEIDPGGIEFQLTVSAWMDLFEELGFDLLGYRELQPPEGPELTQYAVSREWASDFPCEQIWQLRKR